MESWKKNLYTLWITQVISLISFGFGLPFIPFYIQELGVTGDVQIKLFTGILSTAPAITMAIMAPVWGALSDRFGRKLMILRAMLAAVFIIGGMGLVNSVYALIALRATQGLFTGTVTAASAFVAANTPKNRLSFALGFISSSTFIGFSIGPAVGGIIAKYAGYRASFLLGGFIMLIGVIIVALFLKENPNTYGRQALDKQVDSQTKLITPMIVFFLVMLFFQRFARSIFSPYMPLFIEAINGEDNVEVITGLVNLSIGFATAVSSLTITRLGDRFNKPKLISILLTICVLLGLIVARSSSLVYFIVTYTVLFLVLGGIEPLMTSYTAEVTQPAIRGRLFGLQGMIGSFGWMASPLIGSYLSIQYSYNALLIALPVILIINLVISCFVNRVQAT